MFICSYVYKSCGHATLNLAMSVGLSVRPLVHPSVRNIFELRAVFVLLLRLDCHVSGLILHLFSFLNNHLLSAVVLNLGCTQRWSLEFVYPSKSNRHSSSSQVVPTLNFNSCYNGADDYIEPRRSQVFFSMSSFANFSYFTMA